jgi:hypothetical protein
MAQLPAQLPFLLNGPVSAGGVPVVTVEVPAENWVAVVAAEPFGIEVPPPP